jgi:hypothetical protein
MFIMHRPVSVRTVRGAFVILTPYTFDDTVFSSAVMLS